MTMCARAQNRYKAHVAKGEMINTAARPSDSLIEGNGHASLQYDTGAIAEEDAEGVAENDDEENDAELDLGEIDPEDFAAAQKK